MAERSEFLESLAQLRGLLRHTVRDLTDEQAAQRTTVSTLRLGGVIKHVTAGEEGWIDFVEVGTAAKRGHHEEAIAEHAGTFRTGPAETLSGRVPRRRADDGMTRGLSGVAVRMHPC